jgi:hypothetical protein
LWAALQHASGGTWAGCVYDVDRIVAVIDAGLEALGATERPEQSKGVSRAESDGAARAASENEPSPGHAR